MNDNWIAFCVSILKGVLPEVAFSILNNPDIKDYGRVFNEDDTL